MLLLALSAWIYIAFIILLFVALILSILIGTKKVGFQEALRSKNVASILVTIFLCGVLPALLFVWGLIPRSGNQLFKHFILDPAPKSVKVLESYDGGPDWNPDYCLHFTISPADFQLILAAKGWQTVSEPPFTSLDCGRSTDPKNFTFSLSSLGSNFITYIFIPRERDGEVMYINAQMNEGYYFFHDGNQP